MNANTAYRDYLEYHAQNHPSQAKRNEARALLGYVGNDGILNPTFLSAEKVDRGLFRAPDYREKTSNGYTASALNRQINPWWTNSYKEFINSQKSQHKPTPSPTSTGGYYTGGYNAAAAEEARQKAFYQALLNSLPGAKSRDQGIIDQKYSDSFNRLVSQRDQAFGNLDREQSKLDKQRATAYSQIQNDSQNLLQGLNTQLGMLGAGNSSAAQMGAIATADVANKQSAAITDDYNDQVSDITFNRNKIKKDFEDENQELNTWKKEQQTNLEKEYTNLENDYRGKIGGQANLDAVTRSFENMKNPEVKVNTLPDYKANGLDKVDLSGQIKSPQLSAQQAQQYFTNTSTMNKKKEEEKKDGLAV